MTSTRSPLAFILCALCCSLAGLTVYWLSDPYSLVSYDGPWHLATGRLIVETGTVPRLDPFCYTSAGVKWTNLNWLAQLALYKTFEARGFAGPLAAALLALLVTAGATIGNLRQRRVTPLVALPALFLALLVPLYWHSIRPRTLSFALVAVTGWILALPDPEARFGPKRALFLLVMLLGWNQLHGGFTFGYALLSLDALGTALSGWRRERRLPRRALWLGGVVGLALVGFAFHPHGGDALYHVLIYPRHVNAHRGIIGELSALDVASLDGKVVEGVIALFVTVLILRRDQIQLREVLPTLLFIHFCFVYRRFAAVLPLVALPWVAEHLSALVQQRLGQRGRSLDRALALSWDTAPIVLAISGAIGLAVLLGPLARPCQPGGLDNFVKPLGPHLGAVRFLRESGVSGRIYNRLDAGGLLDWVFFAAGRVFSDGRGDIHLATDTNRNYFGIAQVRPGWKQLLDGYRVELVMVRSSSPLPPLLHEHYGWRVLYNDRQYCVVQRTQEDPLPSAR
ncbi:MAG TPA: hypothetical protein DEA08_25380 [Planctomycetes bacterium]|nr:hypothetical protein [Planctomycetota bacterium]